MRSCIERNIPSRHNHLPLQQVECSSQESRSTQMTAQHSLENWIQWSTLVNFDLKTDGPCRPPSPDSIYISYDNGTSYVMFSCPAKPVSPYFFATTPAIRPQTARSTLYIFMVLWTTFSFSIASDICTHTNRISSNFVTGKFSRKMAEERNLFHILRVQPLTQQMVPDRLLWRKF